MRKRSLPDLFRSSSQIDQRPYQDHGQADLENDREAALQLEEALERIAAELESCGFMSPATQRRDLPELRSLTQRETDGGGSSPI